MQQFCADTEYNLENLPGAMDDREWWWERVREIVLAAQHDDEDDEG